MIYRKETLPSHVFVDRLSYFTFTIFFSSFSRFSRCFFVRSARGAYPKERKKEKNRVSTRATCIKRVQCIYSRDKSKRTSSIFLYIRERKRGRRKGGEERERKREKNTERCRGAVCLRVYKIPSECLSHQIEMRIF